MSDKNDKAGNPDMGRDLTFHYIKGPFCTDHPVTGVFGGVDTATGRFSMAVFSERGPIPKSVSVHFEGDAEPVEREIETLEGIVRSISAVMHFDINTAMSMRQWLDERIDAFFKEHPEVKVKTNERG